MPKKNTQPQQQKLNLKIRGVDEVGFDPFDEKHMPALAWAELQLSMAEVAKADRDANEDEIYRTFLDDEYGYPEWRAATPPEIDATRAQHKRLDKRLDAIRAAVAQFRENRRQRVAPRTTTRRTTARRRRSANSHGSAQRSGDDGSGSGDGDTDPDPDDQHIPDPYRLAAQASKHETPATRAIRKSILAERLRQSAGKLPPRRQFAANHYTKKALERIAMLAMLAASKRGTPLSACDAKAAATTIWFSAVKKHDLNRAPVPTLSPLVGINVQSPRACASAVNGTAAGFESDTMSGGRVGFEFDEFAPPALDAADAWLYANDATAGSDDANYDIPVPDSEHSERAYEDPLSLAIAEQEPAAAEEQETTGRSVPPLLTFLHQNTHMLAAVAESLRAGRADPATKKLIASLRAKYNRTLSSGLETADEQARLAVELYSAYLDLAAAEKAGKADKQAAPAADADADEEGKRTAQGPSPSPLLLFPGQPRAASRFAPVRRPDTRAAAAAMAL